MNSAAGLKWFGDLAALAVVGVAAVILLDVARYAPEIGYDESASALALSLREGHFGNPIDPIGPFLTRQVAMDAYPPVYYAASALLFEFTGFGIVQARAVSVLFVAGTALLCYAAARLAAGPGAGLLALAAYLYVPLRVYTVVARPDVAVPFFLVAALLAFEFGYQTRQRAAALIAGLCLSLAVLSHFAALMAAPIVAAYILVYSPRGARGRTLVDLAVGAALPIAVYLWLLFPHWLATLQHFVNYRQIGLAGMQSDTWLAMWPVRPSLKHFEVLDLYHPALLWAAGLILAAAVAASLRCLKGRFALDDRIRRLCWLFVALFVAIGCYPNIAIYGYYGPIYLCVGAVALGGLVATWMANLRLPRVGSVIAGLAMCVTALVALNGVRLSASAYSDGITVAGVQSWSDRFATELSTPVVIATPHWVFSAARERVRTFRILVSDHGRAVLLDGYAARNPDFPEPHAIEASLVDRYNEINNVQALLTWHAAEGGSLPDAVGERIRRARLNMTLEPVAATAAEYRRLFLGFFDFLRDGFRVQAMLFDRTRLSSNGALLLRSRDPVTPHDGWPRVSLTSQNGVEDGHIDAPCTAVADGPFALRRQDNLWSLELPLAASPALANRLVVARVALSGLDHGAEAPYAFVAHYPSASEAEIGRQAFAEARVPPMAADAALGIAGFLLPEGRRGRDLLIRIRTESEAGVLATYATGELRITHVAVAAVLGPGESCDAGLRAAVAGLLRGPEGAR